MKLHFDVKFFSERAVIARCFAFILALSVVLGSSCTPKRQQQTTLRIWQTAVDPKAVAVLKEVGAELERKHPGLRIEIESIAWGALSAKLTAAIGAGDPPDIAHLEPFMFSSMQSKNLLEPLDDVISSLNPDDIYPAVKDLQLFEGRRYGIAHAFGITYFGYRKDLADQKGLKVPKLGRNTSALSRVWGRRQARTVMFSFPAPIHSSWTNLLLSY